MPRLCCFITRSSVGLTKFPDRSRVHARGKARGPRTSNPFLEIFVIALLSLSLSTRRFAIRCAGDMACARVTLSFSAWGV